MSGEALTWRGADLFFHFVRRDTPAEVVRGTAIMGHDLVLEIGRAGGALKERLVEHTLCVGREVAQLERKLDRTALVLRQLGFSAAEIDQIEPPPAT